MSKRLGISISGRRYDIDVEDGFALFLEECFREDFNTEGNNDIKVVLQAYVRKVHELFIQEQKIEEITKKIDKID